MLGEKLWSSTRIWRGGMGGRWMGGGRSHSEPSGENAIEFAQNYSSGGYQRGLGMAIYESKKGPKDAKILGEIGTYGGLQTGETNLHALQE